MTEQFAVHSWWAEVTKQGTSHRSASKLRLASRKLDGPRLSRKPPARMPAKPAVLDVLQARHSSCSSGAKREDTHQHKQTVPCSVLPVPSADKACHCASWQRKHAYRIQLQYYKVGQRQWALRRTAVN